MYLSFSFFYDFSIPPAVIFTLYDNSGAVAGTFTIDLSNSIDCLTLATATSNWISPKLSIRLIRMLSEPFIIILHVPVPPPE